jgi:hypothetical protein
LTSVNVIGKGNAFASSGRSFATNCSWSAIVLVATASFFPSRAAHASAGTR